MFEDSSDVVGEEDGDSEEEGVAEEDSSLSSLSSPGEVAGMTFLMRKTRRGVESVGAEEVR